MAGAARWEVASGEGAILEAHTSNTLCVAIPRSFASSNEAAIFTMDSVGRSLSKELPTDGALFLTKATSFWRLHS